MKIAHISLENFTSYRERQMIRFGMDDKYITILEGQMGHGKSNLLNAFFWCLFNQYWDSDQVKLVEDPDPNEFKLFNLATLDDEAIDGKKVSLFVEIEFWDDEGNKYNLERSLSGHFMRKTWKFDHESALTLQRVSADDGQTASYTGRQAEAEIERFFPKSLSQYFLFRGENRAQLVKLQGKQEFQKALGELSKIEVFKRSVRHLNAVIDIFEREAGSLASSEIKRKIEDTLERKKDADQVLEEYNQQLNDLENKLQSKIDLYNDYSEKIGKNDATHKLQQERDQLQHERATLLNQQKDLLASRNRELARHWGVLTISDVLDNINKRYAEAVDSGNYPPNIHPSVIEKILAELRCICGRDIDKKSVEYKIIEQLKSQESYDKIIRDVESLMADAQRIQVHTEKIPEKIKDYDKQNTELKGQLSEKQKLINHLEKQIGDSDVSMEDLLNKQRDAKDEELKTSRKIDEINNLIGTKEKELREIEKEREDYEDKLDKSQLPVIKLSLARKALKEAENLKQKFEESIYKDLEKYTQEHWGILVYNKLNYDNIRLDRENMYFDVLDKNSISRRSSMNTGHSILLVLSFISALIRIAKETWKVEFPLVLDAPLSEIGDSAMPSALNGFGKVFNQAIVILKDGSVPPSVSEELKGKIGKRYWIEYDDQIQHSNIKELKSIAYG
ncbi:MAG: AAA family ATPase [Bacteriovoracia bacterium]